MVDGDSADVWARQYQFRLDASIGAPPDAFSATGQNWGMPLYRWDVIAAEHFRWLHERVRRSADLYDGYRVDHLVGFYRTFAWPKDGGEPFFTPADEPTQIALGERLLSIFREAGLDDHRRGPRHRARFRPRVAGSPGRPRLPRASMGASLARQQASRSAIPPEYPAISVATSGTHDTESMAVWWDHAPAAGARADRGAADGSANRRQTSICRGRRYNPAVRDALLEALFASGSNLLLLPMIDVFGWSDRINEPATIGGTTGPIGFRGQSMGSRMFPPRASARQRWPGGPGSTADETIDVRLTSLLLIVAAGTAAAGLACARPEPAAAGPPAAAVDIDLRDETRSLAARVTGGMTFASLLSTHLSPAEAAASNCRRPGRVRCPANAHRSAVSPRPDDRRCPEALRIRDRQRSFLRIVRSAAESPWVAAVLPIPKTHTRTVLRGTISRESPSLFGAVADARRDGRSGAGARRYFQRRHRLQHRAAAWRYVRARRRQTAS